LSDSVLILVLLLVSFVTIMSYFTDHLCFIAYLSLYRLDWWIDLFSCTAAQLQECLIKLLTCLLIYLQVFLSQWRTARKHTTQEDTANMNR